MRFAIQNDSRIEATPRARGTCPGCKGELVAKCGTIKVWHWAHKGRLHCDPWWENETQWHRDWKNAFPVDWQEVPARDQNGETHIADVKTPHGMVVEFQHSSLSVDEARKRTAFYGNIIWAVDGTRRNSDWSDFSSACLFGKRFRAKGLVVNRLRPTSARLLREWWQLGVNIAFDFGGETVWLLRRYDLSYSPAPFVVGFDYPKANLVASLSGGSQFPDIPLDGPAEPWNFEQRWRG